MKKSLFLLPWILILSLADYNFRKEKEVELLKPQKLEISNKVEENLDILDKYDLMFSLNDRISLFLKGLIPETANELLYDMIYKTNEKWCGSLNNNFNIKENKIYDGSFTEYEMVELDLANVHPAYANEFVELKKTNSRIDTETIILLYKITTPIETEKINQEKAIGGRYGF